MHRTKTKIYPFAIAADIHFQLQPRYSKKTVDGFTSRLIDRIDAFRWMCETAVNEGATTLVIAGDIFHDRENVPSPVIDAVSQCIQFASKMFKHVYLIVGNHDSYLRTPKVTPLRALAGDNVVVVDRPMITDDLVALVPWVHEQDAYQKQIDQLEGKVNLIVSHVLLKQVAPNGLTVDWKRIPEVWLGDVHQKTEFRGDNGERIRYVGTLLPQDKSDIGNDTGFYILSKKASFHLNYISPVVGEEDTDSDVDVAKSDTESPEAPMFFDTEEQRSSAMLDYLIHSGIPEVIANRVVREAFHVVR